ncbi:MAG TPA: hypothetical protein VJV39_08095 [Dongiaceae bacterium]|nr:hypothetical protein [Dongiaceae bacterium]
MPFLLIYPQAEIPVVQLSLRQDLDPGGASCDRRALAPLRDAGVLIAGSGMSFHNLRYFGSTDPRVVGAAQRFDEWLIAAVEEPDEEKRSRASYLQRQDHRQGRFRLPVRLIAVNHESENFAVGDSRQRGEINHANQPFREPGSPGICATVAKKQLQPFVKSRILFLDKCHTAPAKPRNSWGGNLNERDHAPIFQTASTYVSVRVAVDGTGLTPQDSGHRLSLG